MQEPGWGESNCFVPHTVYLGISSRLKVGITRTSNIPGRWIDQGAVRALPILGVADRLTAGLVEAELSKEYDDKTDWRKMVRGECDDADVDLAGLREQIFDAYGDLLDDTGAEDLDGDVVAIDYPVVGVPDAVKSLSLDREPLVEGELLGIRGQYLIFAHGVLGVRPPPGLLLGNGVLKVRRRLDGKRRTQRCPKGSVATGLRRRGRGGPAIPVPSPP